MKDDMLIGEFSEVTGVSKRMIRHFDSIGLLSPNYIDECNGYRFYCEEQVRKLHNIKYLQDFGFTLKEIQLNKLEKVKICSYYSFSCIFMLCYYI